MWRDGAHARVSGGRARPVGVHDRADAGRPSRYFEPAENELEAQRAASSVRPTEIKQKRNKPAFSGWQNSILAFFRD
jgi:hypothetical protein